MEADHLSTVPELPRAPALGESEAEDPATSSKNERRRDIQGLRALAVVLVIADHAGAPGFSGGFVGVDVFFVISGYVITQLLLREAPKGARRGLADFYSRRIRRIVPAATATLVVTIVAAELLLGARLNPLLPGDVRWASLFAANVRFISTGSNYFVPGMHPSLVTHFWSLAVEEQFYIVWPVVVFSIARLVDPRYWHRALAATLIAGIAVSAWWSIHLSAGNPVVAYYSPFTRFWELGLGCLLAVVASSRPIPFVWLARLASVWCDSGAHLGGNRQ
jgi:peptidoglycan/LPS O-acetylase OafA/YrhL